MANLILNGKSAPNRESTSQKTLPHNCEKHYSNLLYLFYDRLHQERIKSYYYSRLPTPDSRLPTPDSRLPTPDSLLPTPHSLQAQKMHISRFIPCDNGYVIRCNGTTVDSTFSSKCSNNFPSLEIPHLECFIGRCRND